MKESRLQRICSDMSDTLRGAAPCVEIFLPPYNLNFFSSCLKFDLSFFNVGFKPACEELAVSRQAASLKYEGFPYAQTVAESVEPWGQSQ